MQTKRALVCGFLIWLIPFVVAVAIYPVKRASQVLFDSIMPVVLAVCVMGAAQYYFRAVTAHFTREGLVTGMVWMVMNLLLDAPLFSHGPMKMTVAAYFADIGLTYLMIPVIAIGAGRMLETKR
jgi:hypothetical protein